MSPIAAPRVARGGGCRTSLRQFFLALAATLIAVSRVAAQTAPPVAGIDGRLLRAGVDSLAIFLVRDGDTTRTGSVQDELAPTDLNGRWVLRRVYRSDDRVLGSRVDTTVDELPTLAPISSRSVSRQGLEVLDFEPTRVRGWMRLINGDSVGVDVPVAGAIYNSGTFDLLLRAAPLREGWEAEVPAFLPNTRTIARLRARVAGRDRIGTSDCWRVEAEFTGMPVTFWVEAASRRLCQQVMHVQPGVRILFAAPRPERSPRRAT
jgi:hypothetical protein